jgi:hypothetical protein
MAELSLSYLPKTIKYDCKLKLQRQNSITSVRNGCNLQQKIMIINYDCKFQWQITTVNNDIKFWQYIINKNCKCTIQL